MTYTVEVMGPKLHLIEDWKDYDQGLISTLGTRYFKLMGVDAYSLRHGSPVPSGITNSYPHAHSFVKLLKRNLEFYPQDYVLNILDLGSGSGIFARHLLIAARDEGILERICVLLADISSSALREIKALMVLKDFEEGKNYKFIQLDIFKPETCHKLDGKAFELKNISATTLNYVYDVMPTMVLRKVAGKFEKLQFRFLSHNNNQEVSDQELKTNLNYLRNLLIDERWLDYDSNEQNDLQKKYFNLFCSLYQQPSAEKIIYSYGSLAITESLINLLDDNGFIFAADMNNNSNIKSTFRIYGNSSAHLMNEPLITKLAQELGLHGFIAQDFLLQRMIYFKNKNSLSKLQGFLQEEFIDNSYTDVYSDLKQMLSNIGSPHSKHLAKILVEELKKIDPYSCFSLMMQGQVAKLYGERQIAEAKFKEAKTLDFLKDFDFARTTI